MRSRSMGICMGSLSEVIQIGVRSDVTLMMTGTRLQS
jgi:hypothetical protein